MTSTRTLALVCAIAVVGMIMNSLFLIFLGGAL